MNAPSIVQQSAYVDKTPPENMWLCDVIQGGSRNTLNDDTVAWQQPVGANLDDISGHQL